MYRCAGCDAPALMNCACYTQLERPDDSMSQAALDDRIASSFEEFHAMRQGERHKRVNIASGEDGGLYRVEVA